MIMVDNGGICMWWCCYHVGNEVMVIMIVVW
jgi:hypothetical protein